MCENVVVKLLLLTYKMTYTFTKSIPLLATVRQTTNFSHELHVGHIHIDMSLPFCLKSTISFPCCAVNSETEFIVPIFLTKTINFCNNFGKLKLIVVAILLYIRNCKSMNFATSELVLPQCQKWNMPMTFAHFNIFFYKLDCHTILIIHG